MRFACIGLDDATERFCARLVAAGEQCAAYLDEPAARGADFLKSATAVDRIEHLPKLDFLVLGGTAAERGERLATALQASGVPLAVSTPAGSKPEALYEFALARNEVGARALFLSSELEHPAVIEALAWLADPRCGSIRWVELQLPFDPTAEHAVRFADGWTLLRSFVGEILSITATTPGQAIEAADKPFAQVAVSFESDRGVLGNVRYLKERRRPSLRIETSTGILELDLSSDDDTASMLRWNGDNDERSATVEADDVADRWLTQWRQVLQADDNRFATHALRQVELADAVERSLKRRRPVALDQEEFSQAAGFKSVMTTWGCGLLWATMLIAILAAAGVPYVKYLVPPALIVFLLLQTLGLALRPRAESS